MKKLFFTLFLTSTCLFANDPQNLAEAPEKKEIACAQDADALKVTKFLLSHIAAYQQQNSFSLETSRNKCGRFGSDVFYNIDPALGDHHEMNVRVNIDDFVPNKHPFIQKLLELVGYESKKGAEWDSKHPLDVRDAQTSCYVNRHRDSDLLICKTCFSKKQLAESLPKTESAPADLAKAQIIETNAASTSTKDETNTQKESATKE